MHVSNYTGAQIDEAVGKVLDGKIGGMTSITYDKLKELRDNSELIPGMQYRITDYETIVNNALNGSVDMVRSAGHQFDIIVTADSVNTLNENARAIQHEFDNSDEDDYFANSNLAAWELKYCLDNDTDRFDWATGEGKGVIYYMKDEWNNECPYDFKNIQFARWELSNPICYINDYNYSRESDYWIETSDPLLESLKSGYYGLNNDNYTFKYKWNGEYYMYKVEYTISSKPRYYYTFGHNDFSVKGSKCYGNIIKEYKNENINKICLNNIVLSNNCRNNTFDYDCYNNTFSTYCINNIFGVNCYNNTFSMNGEYNRSNCCNNTFGAYCYNNTFDSDCINNIFGNSFYNNTLHHTCTGNIFGSNCYENTFEHDFSENIFGNGCYNNFVYHECKANSVGNRCFNNSILSESYGNTIGNGIYNKTINSSRKQYWEDD